MVDALRPKASGQSASLPADAKLSESSAKPGKIIPAVAGDKGPLGMVQDPVRDVQVFFFFFSLFGRGVGVGWRVPCHERFG